MGIRSAEAGDLADLRRLHRVAFAGTMGVALGGRYTQAFLRRFVDDPLAISAVAVVDGTVQGYVLGAALTTAATTNRIVAASAVLGIVTRPWLLARRPVRAEAVRRVSAVGRSRSSTGATADVDLPNPVFSLVAIGIAPIARGRGIGRTLVETFEHEAVKRGAASVRLSVYKVNHIACRLYNSAGWTPFPHPTNEEVLYYGRSVGSGSAYPAGVGSD